MKKMPGPKSQLACPPEPWQRCMPLAHFGGHSVIVNPHDRLGFQMVKLVLLARMPGNFVEIPYNEHLTY
jgi:hypothetical protein